MSAILLVFGFGLTVLGHYGIMLGTLTILLFFGGWTVVAVLRRKDVGNAVRLLGIATIAFLGSFALYYRHLVAEIWAWGTGLLGRLTGNSTTLQAGKSTVETGFLTSLGKLPGKVYGLVGGLELFAGVWGGPLFFRAVRGVNALLGSWLGAAALFALLDQVVGDSVRWYYLAAAPVALLAGRFLGLLDYHRRFGRLLVALTLLGMFWYMLTFWVNLIFTRYH